MNYNITHKMSKQFGLPPNEASMYAFAIITGILVVVGVCGNFITMVVIIWSPRLKSVFNLLIMSLCISNMVSALTSVFKIHCLTWGLFSAVNIKQLCSTTKHLSNWMTFNTALHITVFAFLRFVSITKVSLYHKITLPRLKVLIFLSWLLSGIIGFGVGWVRGIRKTRLVMNSVIHLTLIVLMIAFCAATVVAIVGHRQRRQSLRSGSRRGTKKKNTDAHKILQIIFLIGSFILGYLPCAIYNMTTLNRIKKSESHSRWTFGVIQYIFLRISECINPFLYNISSRRLWKETKALLRRLLNKEDLAGSRSREYSDSRRSRENSKLKVETSSLNNPNAID